MKHLISDHSEYEVYQINIYIYRFF